MSALFLWEGMMATLPGTIGKARPLVTTMTILSDATLIFKLEMHGSIINGSVILHLISNLKSEISNCFTEPREIDEVVRRNLRLLAGKLRIHHLNSVRELPRIACHPRYRPLLFCSLALIRHTVRRNLHFQPGNPRFDHQRSRFPASDLKSQI